MRITLDIDADVLRAAKELAQRDRHTVGQVISTLARRGLMKSSRKSAHTHGSRNGVPVLPSRGEVVNLARVEFLMGQEGI